MASICNCNVGLSNTGTPSCVPIQDVLKRLIFVPISSSAGVINEYSISATTFNQAFFDARINSADASTRWFPTPDIENIENVRGEATFETLNNGKRIFIQQGARTFTGVIIKQWATYLKQLEAATCVKFGAFGVDASGNLIGNTGSKAGYLRPIRIDNNTWNPILLMTTDTEVGKIQLSFEWDLNEKDSNLGMVSASDITIDLFDVTGLLDVYGSTPTSISTTSFTIDLYNAFGTAKDKQEIKGLVAADFDLYNNDDALAVTITTVTEGPDGTYVFVFPAQGSGEELTLSVDKNGYDSSATGALESVVIAIP